ncbi:MAG: hypothetical protein IKK82_08180 [Kiritimatiellae bacterium]|nr:hypothetical protein [Kiritimatiellia bacterium]
MILDEVCNARVYDANAFYVLGLPVDTASRKIRRRQEDLVEGVALMGEGAWQNEFDRYLLGDSVAPRVEMAKTLFERLKDPEYFATEMFFWFWPQEGQPDPAIAAIVRGERGTAVRLWLGDKDKSGERGIVARHNLAVVLHFYAIDGENYIRSHMNGITPEYVRSVDQYWKSSFSFWETLVEDDLFWDVFSSRVEKLNDPRLDDEFIDSFRERFPICFDNINADFLVAYARDGKLKESKRHFDYMISTMSGADDVVETMERAFKPMADAVRTLIKQCESVKEPKKILNACREVLNGSRNLVSIFKALVPRGNAYTQGLLNEIVITIDNRLPAYSRDTGDYEPCLKITRELLPLASTPLMEERIRKSIGEWEGLVRQAREECTCCVCGRYQKGMGTKTVKLYNNVHADPTRYGRVAWTTRTISNVPVCSSCALKFEPYRASKFTPVKNALLQGWKIGDGPTQSEMDAVWPL